MEEDRPVGLLPGLPVIGMRRTGPWIGGPVRLRVALSSIYTAPKKVYHEGRNDEEALPRPISIVEMGRKHRSVTRRDLYEKTTI